VGLVEVVLGVGWCTLLGCWIDLTINPSTHQPVRTAPLHRFTHHHTDSIFVPCLDNVLDFLFFSKRFEVSTLLQKKSKTRKTHSCHSCHLLRQLAKTTLSV
jgi:hypothetical protein